MNRIGWITCSGWRATSGCGGFRAGDVGKGQDGPVRAGVYRVFVSEQEKEERRLGPSAARDGEGRPHRRQRESAWLRKTSIGSLPISGRRRKRRWAGRRWAQRRWSRRLQEAAFRKTALAAHASDSWRQQPFHPAIRLGELERNSSCLGAKGSPTSPWCRSDAFGADKPAYRTVAPPGPNVGG